MTRENLNLIKDIYANGGNIVQHLKNMDKTSENSTESIMISYDFQSGSYIKNVSENPEYIENYTLAIAKVIRELDVEFESILEAGVGEATTIGNLLPKLEVDPKKSYGFDISWSRSRYAVEYMKKRGFSDSVIFTGDLFNIPLANNSIDIVYTSHSIEPNGGKEREALLELIRITKKYLILLEPAHEFASVEGKKRMESHGYVRDLCGVAKSLGLNVKVHRLFDVYSNPLNPTGLIIIEKDVEDNPNVQNPLICPITKTPLELIKNSFFTKKGLLVYPIIDGIPCLLEENAIIATHYEDDF